MGFGKLVPFHFRLDIEKQHMYLSGCVRILIVIVDCLKLV